MSVFRTLAMAILGIGLAATPGFATAAQPNPTCLAPSAFIDQVSSAGDWVVEKSPLHAPDDQVKGVIFRDSGMIDVALFRGGCLAAIVVVGHAKPDTMV